MGLTFKLKSTKFLIFSCWNLNIVEMSGEAVRNKGDSDGLHTSEWCPDVTFVPLNISISCVTHVMGNSSRRIR